MMCSIFWYMTLCIPLKFGQRFGGTYHLHLQARRISPPKNHQAKAAMHVGFLLGLFLDPEDGGDIFL
jgi:hypothetical protein